MLIESYNEDLKQPLVFHKKKKKLNIQTEKFLEIHMNSTFSTGTYTTEKLTNKIHCIPLKFRKQIYYSMIHSSIANLALVWRQTTKATLAQLQICQNKSPESNMPWNYPTEKICKKYKIVNIESIIKLQTKTFIHQIPKGLVDSFIDLQKNENIHEHNTRNKANLHVRKKWKHGNKTKVICGIREYNEL